VEERVRALAYTFWKWRAAQQPRTRDDIPRIERPAGWLPRWSLDDVRRYRRDLARFEQQCTELDGAPASVAVQVNRRLLHSAVSRVRWELDLLQLWRRHPGFYVDQSLGAVFDLLLAPAPFSAMRRADLLDRLGAVPGLLATGLATLEGGRDVVADFARVTVEELADVGDRVHTAMRALRPLLTAAEVARLRRVTARAARALEDYAGRVRRLPPANRTAVGADAFRFFLSSVAILPYTVEQLADLARREYERARAREAAEELRCRDTPLPPLPPDAAAQARVQRDAELEVRRFYQTHELLTQPDSLRHYRTAPMPEYLAPLSWLGVTDDLTSATRLAEDATSYLPPPVPDLPFFHHANLVDPRLGIIHEGAHHQQLVLSWAGSDPVRRHYYDSAANEGIAFYNEELLLSHGLLDDNPHARRIAYTFMRLRALRVEVDVGLATGRLDVDRAAAVLAEHASLDAATARQEATFFASTPGQALSYQVGKAQVERLVAQARTRQGEGFRLRHLHDYLWRNGNVPVALLHWEYLGCREEVDHADALGSHAVR
jgi:hypothetical protein